MDIQIRYARREDGARTAYTTLGSGPFLIYPPGFITHLEWNLALRAGDPLFRTELGRRRTVVFYDRHGCGLSDRRRTDFTPDDDMHDVDALLAALAADKADFFGVSWGGLIAVRYA